MTLSYLRACVATTAIDTARAQAARERAAHTLTHAASSTPEQVVLADLDRAALWCTVIAMAAAEAERVVLVESFAYNMPPRHPDATPAAVP